MMRSDAAADASRPVDHHQRISDRGTRSLLDKAEMRRLAPVFLFLLLSGCKGSAGFLDAPLERDTERRLTQQDSVVVEVTAVPGTHTGTLDLNGLARTIRDRLDRRKIQNSSPGSPRRFELAVTISRYDAGNAAARAGQAGLGPTHIDGSLLLTDAGIIARGHRYRNLVADPDTFAWGRMYPASTPIETVERDFAESLAAELVDGQ